MTVEKMNIAECKNSEKYCHNSIGIGIGNTFCQSILLLVLIIVFTSIVNIPDHRELYMFQLETKSWNCKC